MPDRAIAPLEELASKWKEEGKRCYGLAHTRLKVDDSIMAQSVRFWHCADELSSLLPSLASRFEALEAEIADLQRQLREREANTIAAMLAESEWWDTYIDEHIQKYGKEWRRERGKARLAANRAKVGPVEIHKPGQIPVNTPRCDKCGKMFLECQCGRAKVGEGES